MIFNLVVIIIVHNVFISKQRRIMLPMQYRNKSRAIAINKVDKDTKFTAIFVTTFFILIALFFTHQVKADNTDPAEQEKAALFIRALSNRVIDVLGKVDITDEERVDYFRDIFNDGFAVNKIGKLVLGRHRKKATKEELTDYYELFPEFLIKLYATRLSNLDTREINIGRVIPHAKKDIYVRSKIINDEEKSYDVDWRVRPNKAGDYRIIDLKIEGISMARTQRDDFTSRVSASGVGGLNQYMRDIIADVVPTEDGIENITAAAAESSKDKL